MLFTSIVPLAILSLAQSYVATAAVVIQPVSNATLSAGQNVTYTWTGEAPFNVTIRNRYPMYDGQTGKPANYLGRSDEYPLVNTTVTSYTHFVPQNGQYSYGTNWTVYVVIDDSSEGDGSYAESAPLQVSGASAIPTSAPGSGASALTSWTAVQSLALAAVGVLGLSVL